MKTKNMPVEAASSIYDLAQQAGVSTSTVSRVLNHRSGIGSKTRKMILEQARAAGFRPRMRARQRTIAVVTDRNRYSKYGGFVTSLLGSIVQVLSKEDVSVELVTEHNRARLNERLVDGVLAMAWDEETLQQLRNIGDVPVVTLNSVHTPEFSAVATDHRQQALMAVQHFARHGHRRIAMICEEANNWGSRERLLGFKAAMATEGLPADDALVSYSGHQPMYSLLHRIMNTVQPTAIFIACENLGLEATYILQKVLGVRVPHDVSLIGMESPWASQFLSPPMTTIHQPLDELAAAGLSMLLGLIERDREKGCKMLQNRLIERESVMMVNPSRTRNIATTQ